MWYGANDCCVKCTDMVERQKYSWKADDVVGMVFLPYRVMLITVGLKSEFIDVRYITWAGILRW